MQDNPFKFIEPREELPAKHKEEVMSSVNVAVLILRFIQLFIGDHVAVILGKLGKSDKKKS